MKEIQRDIYLNKLIQRRENNSIKVITGIRRAGKSYLLFKLYYDYLISSGIEESRIIRVALDDETHEELLDGKRLGAYVRGQVKDQQVYYIFLDEIQLVSDFEKVLNGLNRLPNLDIYVTGSNSRFLSTDVITEFRGRGDEVRVYPLCFAEFASAFEGDVHNAWKEYSTYGGLPLILTRKTDELKSKYLMDLFQYVYLADILERNALESPDIMDMLINCLASAVGSLTNPRKLARTFAASGILQATDQTISRYIGCLMDAFLINKAERYDIKGKKYIGAPSKYYFSDVGLRNARLNFRQQEENHILENIIYNELLIRGFNVDVGIVERMQPDEASGNKAEKLYEVDFVCNKASRRYYIQSAFAIPDRDKLRQETQSLLNIQDAFKKFILVKDDIKPWQNEEGIIVMGALDFLLNPNSLDY